jgi:hypothetical protein
MEVMKEEKTLAGRRPWFDESNQGGREGIGSVGIKRVPPRFARLGLTASEQRDDRAAAGSLRTLLTSEVSRLVAASLGRSADERQSIPAWLAALLRAMSVADVFADLPPPALPSPFLLFPFQRKNPV